MKYQIPDNDYTKRKINFMNKYCSVEDYGSVSQATERRANEIIRSGNRYSGLIAQIWEQVKSNHPLYREYLQDCKTTVKRLNKVGTTLPNLYFHCNVDRSYEALANGLTIRCGYHEFYYVGNCGCSYCSIRNINEFIKYVYELDY